MEFSLNVARYQKIFAKGIFVLILFFSFFSPVAASEFFFGTQSQNIGKNQIFEVGVFLNTEGEVINAIEGKVEYPPSLQLQKILDGDSLINFWILSPTVPEKCENFCEVQFSGIVPGGVNTPRGYLFSFVFEAKDVGNINITTKDERVLLNNGEGSETKIRVAPLLLNVSEEISIIPYFPPFDVDPPEIFTPEISEDPSLFEGKWFLVFATQDKNSGIDHYEVKESTSFGKAAFVETESPYLLQNQDLTSDISVKAVDKAANERIAFLPSSHKLFWYQNPVIWAIFLGVGFLTFVMWAMFQKKPKRLAHHLVLFGILLGMAVFSGAGSASAASLSLSPSSGTYVIGQTFSVSVFVSSSDQAMNAASGTIQFPDVLQVTSVSKSGSIMNLWAREPSFSGNTVSYEGVVLNPGYTGGSGKILTISGKAVSAGNGTVSFASGLVLANDGQGTNILSGLGSASFTVTEPPPEKPPAPIITSPNKPEQNPWSSRAEDPIVLNINHLPEATGMSYAMDHIPNSEVDAISEKVIASESYKNLEDGIWYFHARYKNDQGWGPTGHFKIQIDKTPPLPFSLTFPEGGASINPYTLVIFSTTDATSGIDHYELSIDGGDVLTISPEEIDPEKPFVLPKQSVGSHTITIDAFDKASNSTAASGEFSIIPTEGILQKEIINCPNQESSNQNQTSPICSSLNPLNIFLILIVAILLTIIFILKFQFLHHKKKKSFKEKVAFIVQKIPKRRASKRIKKGKTVK